MSLLEKTRDLQEPIRSFFWSDEPRFLCEDICFLYDIPEKNVGDVSFFVAPLLTKTLPLANLPKELRVKFPDFSEGVTFGIAFELNKRIVCKFPTEFPEALPLLSEWEKKKSKPVLAEEEAHNKTLTAESWYLDWKKQNEAEAQSEPVEKISQTVSIPLLDALSKYQRLSEQTVTEDRIAVKGESMPVRGSLRNWVRHYRDVLGIRKHSALERGQMLFQGENTKRLGGAEREKLALIFRSLDENIPLSIDTGRQEIIFPAFEEKAGALASPASPEGSEKSLPSIGTSFRPVEKFPARTAPIKKALEWNGSQRVPEPSQGPESPGLSVPVYGSAPASSLGLGDVPPAASGLEGQNAAGAPFSLGGKMSFSSQHKLPSEQERVNQRGASDVHQVPQSNPASQVSQRVGIIRPRGNRFDSRDASSETSPSRDSSGPDSSPVVNLRGRQQ